MGRKEHFRRTTHRYYSHRYQVSADAGPPDDPIVAAGATIIESRYRGRSASWSFKRSMVDDVSYTVDADYVERPEETAQRILADRQEPGPETAAARTIAPQAAPTPHRTSRERIVTPKTTSKREQDSIAELRQIGRAILDSAFGIGDARKTR